MQRCHVALTHVPLQTTFVKSYLSNILRYKDESRGAVAFKSNFPAESAKIDGKIKRLTVLSRAGNQLCENSK